MGFSVKSPLEVGTLPYESQQWSWHIVAPIHSPSPVTPAHHICQCHPIRRHFPEPVAHAVSAHQNESPRPIRNRCQGGGDIITLLFCVCVCVLYLICFFGCCYIKQILRMAISWWLPKDLSWNLGMQVYLGRSLISITQELKKAHQVPQMQQKMRLWLYFMVT